MNVLNLIGATFSASMELELGDWSHKARVYPVSVKTLWTMSQVIFSNIIRANSIQNFLLYMNCYLRADLLYTRRHVSLDKITLLRDRAVTFLVLSE